MRIKHVIWAVDPFSENKKLLRLALASIQSLLGDKGGEIEPVYVSGVDRFETAMKFPSGATTELRTAAQRELDHAIQGMRVPGLKPLRVIAKTYLSLRESTEAVVEYARSICGDLIVLSTHSKKGPKRWIMGSFAETLVLHCDLPLLIVNPHWKPKKSFKSILFPTDFSKESHDAYTRIISLAKQLSSEMTLYHRFRYDLTPTLQYAMESSDVYALAYEDELAVRHRDAEKWSREAKNSGVKIKTIIDTNSGESVASSIIRQAERRSSLIAMASHSGPVSATLMGSCTRSVLRASPYPVWIIHPGARIGSHRKAITPLFTVSEGEIEEQLFKKCA